MQTWETNLGPQNAIQRADGRPNPFAFCGWTSRSLQEILQGQYFINDPLVAFEGAEPMHPDAMDDPEKYNTYFEINLELIGDGKNAVLGPLSAARLDIYAFSQVDILAIQEQFNINEPEFLASLGSSIIIENCLVKDKLNQYNTNLKVAETRKAYFTENDVLYQGKVHYHGAANPGPGGYIGWMAGLRDGPMGTKLSVRDIPNNKVTYKSSTQRAVNYEGTPLTANNFFSGFTMNPQVFAADDGLLSFGDNVREALLSHLGHIGAIGPQISDLESQQNIETLGRYQRYSNKLRELVI